MNLIRRLLPLQNWGGRTLFRYFGTGVFFVFVFFEVFYPFQASAQIPVLNGLLEIATGPVASGVVTAIFSYLMNLLLSLVLAPIVVIATAVNLMLTAIMVILGMLLDEVMKFAVSVPYTANNPALLSTPENPLKIGWETVRDLANMGLLFVLIAIAIGTILQIGATRWRSLFIPFVVIALLINFTPVITGLVIDLSNILTKVFFDQAGGSWKAFAHAASQQEIGGLLNDIGAIFQSAMGGGDTSKILNIFLNAIFMIVFQILVIATFMTLIFLIFARILALWLLVILSPLAFVAYILPQTKNYFSGWWHNFFQWSIITIPFGFFMWLAALFLSKADVMCNKSFADNLFSNIGSAVSGGSSTVTNLIAKNTFLTNMCGSMMLLMAIGILFVGIMIAFSFSATGSKLIVGGGVAAGAAIGGWAAAKVGGLAMRGAERVGGGVASRLTERGGLREKAQRIGEHIGEKRRMAVSGLERGVGTLGPAGGAIAKGTGKGREISEKTALVKVWEATAEQKKKKADEAAANFRKEWPTMTEDERTERLRMLPGMSDENTVGLLSVAKPDLADPKYNISVKQRRTMLELAGSHPYNKDKILEDLARRNPTDILNNTSADTLQNAFKTMGREDLESKLRAANPSISQSQLNTEFETTTREEAKQKILKGVLPQHLSGENKIPEEALMALIGDPNNPSDTKKGAEFIRYLTIQKARAIRENYLRASESLDRQMQNLISDPAAFAEAFGSREGRTLLKQASGGKNAAWEQAGFTEIMPSQRAVKNYLATLAAANATGSPLPDPTAFI